MNLHMNLRETAPREEFAVCRTFVAQPASRGCSLSDLNLLSVESSLAQGLKAIQKAAEGFPMTISLLAGLGCGE